MRLTRQHFKFFVAILVVAAAATLFLLPNANQRLLNVLEQVRSAGPWGPLVMIAVYMVGSVLFVPGSILTIGAGFIFGIPLGTATVSIGSTLGAGTAFLLARTLLRDWIGGRITAHPRFRALDEAVAGQGFKIVLLTRLSPLLPFNLLNYAFGLTKVRLRDYMLASWIGMLPGALLYVSIGAGMKSLAELFAGRREPKLGEWIWFGFGLLATGVVFALLVRVSRKALAGAVTDSAGMAEKRRIGGDGH
jgi:uncharacterized membrane protein YdjX (TVP38/TMEM64 family)